jgi:hypothetical protein
MQYGLRNKFSAHNLNHHLSRLNDYKSAYVQVLIFISLLG